MYRGFSSVGTQVASPPANHATGPARRGPDRAGDMTPSLLSHPTPLSPASSAIPRFDSTPRLNLHPVLDRRAVVDGAWWPYSRDAAAELPALIAAVDQRLGRTTLRVGVHQDAWRHIPRHIPARGRQIRIGWSGHTDPRVITLLFACGEPVVLLIIPPDTPPRAAGATLKLTTQDITGLTPEGALPREPWQPGPLNEQERAGHRTRGDLLDRRTSAPV